MARLNNIIKRRRNNNRDNKRSMGMQVANLRRGKRSQEDIKQARQHPQFQNLLNDGNQNGNNMFENELRRRMQGGSPEMRPLPKAEVGFNPPSFQGRVEQNERGTDRGNLRMIPLGNRRRGKRPLRQLPPREESPRRNLLQRLVR